MSLVTSPTLQDIFTVLAPWLVSVTGLPQANVLQGIPNRTAAPLAAPGYITMTMIRRDRLNTNIDTWDQTIDDPDETTQETHFAVTVQLDFYSGPSEGNSSGSAFDWCSMIESLWRDDVAVQALAPTIAPLYTNASRMAPLDDSEDQYEQRWILEAVLQYNPVTSVPTQFADALTLTVINVDEAYPP
jgi:hypothetical protein